MAKHIKRKDGTIVADERNGNKITLSGVGIFIGIIVAIIAPIIAIGDFKGATSNRLLTLESKALADESEIKTHEDRDFEKAEVLAGKLGAIQTSIDNQTQVLNEMKASMSKMWQVKNERNNT